MANGKHTIKKEHKTFKFKKAIILILILLIILIAIYITINKFDLFNTITTETSANVVSVDGYSATLDNGTKKNVSDTIKKTHTVENLESIEISNLTIISDNDVSTIQGIAKNTSKTEQSAFTTKLNLLLEDGTSVIELKVKINSIPAKSKIEFSAVTTIDLTDVKDYTIKAIN